jgi:uncharacterized membrane protein
MSYATRFRRSQYIKGSLWIAPLIGALAATLVALIVDGVEHRANLPEVWQFSSSTASTFLSILAGASVSLIGFVITVSVLVVQISMANLTPRSLRIWYRDPILKAVLAILTGTFMFTFAELRRITPEQVPNVGVIVAGFGQVVSILVFLLFLDRFLHQLRPVKVAEVTSEVAKNIVAGSAAFQDHSVPADDRALPAAEPSSIVTSESAGVVQAIDETGLVSWAVANRSLVVLPVAVGDFVAVGDPLVEVYGEQVPDVSAPLKGMIALGLERTIDQDPAFALRVMVDISTRALSPALNDPTTAVQILGRIADLLRCIGKCELRVPARLRDAGGESRVLLPVPSWDDYLMLGLTEIREYGRDSIQVVRALRKHLEDLHREVLPQHRAAVEEELRRLEADVQVRFSGSSDLDRARSSDVQGIGGPSGQLRRMP